MNNLETLKKAIELDKKLARLDDKVTRARAEFNLVQSERSKLILYDGGSIWEPERNKYIKIGSKLYQYYITPAHTFTIKEIKVEVS